MTIPQLDEKIAEKEARLAVLKSECEQLERDLSTAKAFRAAFPRIMGTDSRTEVVTPSHTPSPIDVLPLIPPPAVSVPNAIRDAVARGAEEFTVYDIERLVSEAGHSIPRLIISRVLSDWARKEKISVKVQGAGRSVSTYSKTPPAGSSAAILKEL